MKLRQVFSTLLVMILLAACSPAVPATPGAESTASGQSAQAPAGQISSPAPELPAAETPAVPLAPTPTTQYIYPTLESQEITPERINQLTQLKILGDGRYRDVAASTDGKWLAVASALGVRLHDANTLQEMDYIPSPAPVARVVFSADGTRLAAGTQDGMLRLYTLADGKQVAGSVLEIRAAYFPLLALGFSPDGSQVAAGSLDRTIQVWDTASGVRTRSVSGFTLGISTLAFNADGSLLAGGSVDGQTRVWRVRTGEVLGISGDSDKKRLSASAYPIQLAFSTDEQLLLMLADGTAQTWNWQEEDSEPELAYAVSGGAASAVFSLSDNNLLTADQAGTIRSLDLASYQVTRQFNTGEDLIAAAPLPGGTNAAVIAYPSTLLLVDLEKGAVSKVYSPQPQGGRLVAGTFSADGRWLAAAHADGLVRVWDATNYMHFLVMQPKGLGETRTLKFSPDGSLLYLGGEAIAAYPTAGFAELLEVANQQNSGPVNINPTPALVISLEGTVGSLDVSPDGQLLAVTTQLDKTARVYRLPSGDLAASLTLYPDPAEMAVFAPDGKTLAVGAADHNVYTWSTQNLLAYTGEASSGPAPDLLIRNEYPALGLAFSPDAAQLAIIGSYPQGRVVKASNGGLIFRLKGVKEQITSVAFAPNGTLIASGDVNGRIRLYTAKGEDPAAILSGHAGAVNWLAFSPDGTQLVSGGEDGTVRIWGIPLP
jgi:WD40 repeat protein